MVVQGKPSVAWSHAFAGNAEARSRERKAAAFPDKLADQETLVGENSVEAPSEIVDQKASRDWSETAENSAAD